MLDYITKSDNITLILKISDLVIIFWIGIYLDSNKKYT